MLNSLSRVQGWNIKVRNGLIAIFLLSGTQALAMDEIQKSVSDYLFSQCRQDLDQYCKGITPGENRIATCLSAYKYKLSPVCNEALSKIGKKMQASQTAMQRAVIDCRTDIEKKCPDLKPGRAHVLSCFSKLKSQLTKTCNASLKQYRATLKH
ncbi:MAG: hypothetical protein ACR2PH_11480 [Desulfobulbia bacterium]